MEEGAGVALGAAVAVAVAVALAAPGAAGAVGLCAVTFFAPVVLPCSAAAVAATPGASSGAAAVGPALPDGAIAAG
ncbi:MAG: hypothetical protein DYH12_09125, partial [Sorangiineae bacterium PRO1]|nr:hypothetical protein [Sorangiineae bacterium PRO1]